MIKTARRLVLFGIFWSLLYFFCANLVPSAIDRELDCQKIKIERHLDMLKRGAE